MSYFASATHAAPQMLADYQTVRQHTMNLVAGLSPEDCTAQSMPDASPVKWHLAHTTWFFETFILERFEPGFQPFHPAFRMLFNSYYNGIGDKHVRAQRGLITRPCLDEVLAYRHQVDARIHYLCQGMAQASAGLSQLMVLGLHHEQQHQELLLTDFKHLLSMNPLRPAYRAQVNRAESLPEATWSAPLEWREFDAGLVDIGHAGEGFFYDNETPRHRQWLERFALATRLVTNGEYLAFIADGGYRDPRWWLSEGWDWVCTQQLSHPLYWQRAQQGALVAPDTQEDDWLEFTLQGLEPLDRSRPVVHLAYFEADAYARWAGARLPTEAEWERAASSCGGAVTESSQHTWQSSSVARPSVLRVATGNARVSSEPTENKPRHLAESARFKDLFGSCWQWTSSSYAPYPGYQPAAGAIGEYNGKFMVNQYVLRGSSCATPLGHSRLSYRNFFPATARWQFSGLRLARSCS